MQAAVDGVPNIGVRFDYQSLAPGYTPLFRSCLLNMYSLRRDYFA